MVWRISKSEWKQAKEFLEDKPDGTKYYKKQSRLHNSFVLINGKIYALQPKTYLGKGTYAKTKFVQDEDEQIYLAKITYKNEFSTSMPISVLLARKLGLISGTSLTKENKILTDLNLSKGYAKTSEEGKEIIVMEYLGHTLSHYLKNNKLTDAKEFDLALQLLNKLDDIHTGRAATSSKMRIHGDLKEDNITIDEEGRVHIIDFGLSQKAVNGKGKIATGTPGYVAPEVKDMFPTSFQSDIYSLGIIFTKSFSNFILKGLASLMTLHDRGLRPDIPLLSIPLLVMNHQTHDLLRLGFSDTSAKAVAAILLGSDENNVLYMDEELLRSIRQNSNPKLISYLATAFDYLQNTTDKQSHGRTATRIYIQNLIKLPADKLTLETIKYLKGEPPYSMVIGKGASTPNTNSRLAFFYNKGLLDPVFPDREPSVPFEKLDENKRKELLLRIKT